MMGAPTVADRPTDKRCLDGGGQVAAVDDQADEGNRGVDSAQQQPPLRRNDRELHDEQRQQRTRRASLET